MDYRNLPPGLERRLAYSYHIRTNEPSVSVRSNNRMFRIHERHERYRHWCNNSLYFGSIRTNVDHVEREQNTGVVRYTLYDNFDNESEYLIEDDLINTDIPNGDLSELTNELANLIIVNQQNYDEQYQQFDTEELPESLHELETDADNRLLNSPRLTVSPQTATNFWPTERIGRHMRNRGTAPNDPLSPLTPPEQPGQGPLEPPGLEHFRGMFNHTEHRENFTFNNLIDIEKGVISKNLVEKSKVVYYWDTQQNNTQNNTQQENSVVGGLHPLCSICRENFEYIDIIRQLNCEHVFHINCIDTWFTKNKTCPECRYEI